ERARPPGSGARRHGSGPRSRRLRHPLDGPQPDALGTAVGGDLVLLLLEAVANVRVDRGQPVVEGLEVGEEDGVEVADLLFQEELALLDPCFKYKDEFLATHGLSPWIGMYVVELFTDKKGRLTQVIANYRNYRPYAISLLENKK
ncbi:MAG TPA: hypothetical protein P5056_02460, partial [Candidatus Paceibacterota bacterium]|nr:hypothetical protein [Candidatus Paceibacterota bacterium]